MQIFLLALNSLRRYAAPKCGRHGYPLVTLNDLPSPCGCWKKHYDAKQRVYNIHLLLGISTLILTIAFGAFNNLFQFAFTPDRPADIESYK